MPWHSILYLRFDSSHGGLLSMIDENARLNAINAVMSRKDYDAVWQQLVDDIMNNDVPWQQEWDNNIGKILAGFPISGSSGREYTGFNRLFLMYKLRQLHEDSKEFDPRFYTFGHIEKLNEKQRQSNSDKRYHLLKNSKACIVKMHFFVGKDKDGNPLPLEEQHWVSMNLPLFHPSQIRLHEPVLDADGNKIPLLDADGNQKIGRKGELLYQMQESPFPAYTPRFRPYTHEETNELIELLIKKTGAQISHDRATSNAYYPLKDELHLTPPETFKDINDYYRTVLHELCHWTGHKSRLNRDLSGKFGSQEYAREELRVETAAAFICSSFNIPLSPNHGAYLKSWLTELGQDPNELEQAQQDAHKIVNYVRSLIKEKIREMEIVRELEGGEYIDFEGTKKPDKSMSSSQDAVNMAKALSVVIYKPGAEAKWRDCDFVSTIKDKILVDFNSYNAIAATLITVKNDVMAALTRSNMELNVGDVVKVADRLFYINKPGQFTNMAENNFYQEVTLRNFKGAHIMMPLEGEIREKIKHEQMAMIGEKAFEQYRSQYREIFFTGSVLNTESCNDIESRYKKFIYDHVFEYGYSGIRPCDEKAWQKADSDFCIQVLNEKMGSLPDMLEAANAVEKCSPYAVAHPDIDYADNITTYIMRSPEYQQIRSANVNTNSISDKYAGCPNRTTGGS